MAASKTPKQSTRKFKTVIETIQVLRYRGGLLAIPKKEGRGRISAKIPSHLLGSVNIDKDCAKDEPQANRWDFAIGYHRSAGPFVYFVEVHSATTSEVSCIEKKLAWLEEYLRRDSCASLSKLPRELHWVASRNVKIPKNTPQYRRLPFLRKRGLNGPVERLKLT